jgi:hypothetical protein
MVFPLGSPAVDDTRPQWILDSQQWQQYVNAQQFATPAKVGRRSAHPVPPKIENGPSARALASQLSVALPAGASLTSAEDWDTNAIASYLGVDPNKLPSIVQLTYALPSGWMLSVVREDLTQPIQLKAIVFVPAWGTYSRTSSGSELVTYATGSTDQVVLVRPNGLMFNVRVTAPNSTPTTSSGFPIQSLRSFVISTFDNTAYLPGSG